ncbi:hypothetical protein RhiirC2_711479 [Rhizophagus irregularis]|uniref:Uncharacterized protein n=1 Tax=Rhizophagus irregularis TaxID=588596 RepID=A0A2N1NAQ0_9GLOM|nr:hypothetical protein RhiirC2_711479 [Rhizophagus irregularis]
MNDTIDTSREYWCEECVQQQPSPHKGSYVQVKGVQKKFSNFNFNYKLPFNGRVDDEKIKADIEEEWFKRRRSLFEYNEFNDIEEISQGKCDIVNRAVINNRIQFAFKRLIDKRTLKIEKDDKKKDCK